MKKLLLLFTVITSLAISACASKTTYVEIQQPTKIWMSGKAIYTAQPGDILRVIESKICRSGKGTCWWVKNDKKGYGGIVSADEMKILHRVYESDGKIDKTNQKKEIRSEKNNGVLKEYSNSDIGVYFQYPAKWNIHDNQDEIGSSKLSFFKDEVDSANIVFVTPSEVTSFDYDLDSFDKPFLSIVSVGLPPGSSDIADHQFIDDYAQYKASVFRKSGGEASEPSTVMINENEWTYISATIDYPTNGFVESYTYMSNDDKLFEITAMGKLTDKDNHIGDFNKIIRSIRLTGVQ